MRKISFKMRNIGSEKYLSYILNDDCEFDEELLDYLEENRIPELIDIIYEEDDENDYLTYNITGRTTVETLLSDKVNAEMILGIVRGTASGIVNLRDLGIPASYVILNKDFTYVNPVTYDIGMLCVPVESEANINAEFRMFVRDLLTSVTYDDSEDCNYVAKLLNMLNVEKFTVRNFYAQLTELMESAGMEVDENFVDIDSDVSVSQTGVDVSSKSDTTMDDLPEYQDVAFGGDDEDESEMEDAPESDAASIFKDIDFDAEEKKSADIDMSVFDDSVFDDLELDEDEDEGLTEMLTSEDGEESDMSEDADEDTASNMTEIAHTADGVTEVELAGESEPAPELISTDKLPNNPPVRKTIKVNRAKIIQQAASEAEESAPVDNPTEQIVAPEYAESKDAEPETNMEPAAPGKEPDETDSKGSTVELTGGVKVVKDVDTEPHPTQKNVPKAMPYIVRVNTGERVMVNKAVFKIGKAGRGVDFTIGGNGAISKIHAIIYQRDDGCYIKDNKATNATYINGTKLNENEEVKLEKDSTISMGGEDFLFKLS